MNDLEQELTKAAQALESLTKANPATPQKSQGEEMSQAEFDAILDTFKTLGPEAMKKSVANLNEKQLRMVQSVLEKATSVQDAAVKQPEPLHDLASKELKKPEGGDDDEDEKLVKEENKDVKHQGDDSELSGQVIKSFSDVELTHVIRRMQERKLAKADCMGALEQYGQPKEKMEKMWDATQTEAPKPESKPEEKKENEAPDAKANAAADKDIKEGLKQDDGFKDESKQDEKAEMPEKKEPEMASLPKAEKKEAPKPEAKSEDKPPFMKKSVTWKKPIAPFNEALTKRGRNCHYNVDGAIAEAAEKTSMMLKSGNWISDPYAKEETLKKSEPSKKVTVNDFIEQGLDYAPGQLELVKAKKDWKPAGSFTVKSFDEKDLNVANAEPLEKALPRGEGTRGGHIIGHTTTGKPIYADPKHPEHQHFTDEEHYDAHLGHAQHQMAHQNVLNGPSNKGNSTKHVMSAASVQHHSKAGQSHLDRIKSKDISKLHPQLKSSKDLLGHGMNVATSKFKGSESSQVSTKNAPEQK